MNKWTILSVVCLGALVVSAVEARTVRCGGGCANGQCGTETAPAATAPAETAPAETAPAPTGTQAITTAASGESTKVVEKGDVKVETTDKAPAAPAAAAPQQRTTRFASGRFFRLRRSFR